MPGVRRVEVSVDDHFAADVISAGVAGGHGFVGTFGDLAQGELDQLRVEFLRKAVLAATHGSAGRCWPRATTPQAGAAHPGGAPDSAELDRLRSRRRDLGLAAENGAPLVIDPVTGAAVGGDDLVVHRHRARLTALNMETNGSICTALLQARTRAPRRSAVPAKETPCA